MKNDKAVRLEIPNNPDYILLALPVLENFAALSGFGPAAINEASIGLEEALKNIILHGYPKETPGLIKLDFELTPKGMIISILDDGAPLDQELFRVPDLEELQHELPESGYGLYLIRHFYDFLDIQTVGKAGNITRMEKYFSGSQLTPQKSRKIGVTDWHPTEKKIAFNVGLLRPNDAVSVSKLAYIAYHHTYPFDPVYIPAKVREMNHSGALISAIARLQDSGEIISHSALEFHEDIKKIAEIGVAFTNPQYRGQGTINRIWDYLLNEVAAENKIRGVYASCVTTHPYSQKVAHKYGFNDVALFAGTTQSLDFENIQKKSGQRESLLITLKMYGNPEPDYIYPPARHRDILLKTFENLGVGVKLGSYKLTSDHLSMAKTAFKIERDDAFHVAGIKIAYFGKDVLKQTALHLNELKLEKREAIRLYMSLSHPLTESICAEFEKMGFFYCGIMPDDHSFNLVLQYLNNQCIDYSALEINSGFGKILVDYVQNCDPGVSLPATVKY